MYQGFHLSPQQKSLWLQSGGKEDPAYRSQIAIHVEGVYDFDLLKAAVRGVITRNEILRTVFHRLPGMTMPVQVVTDKNECLMALDEFPDEGFECCRQRLQSRMEEIRRLPFDLENGPMLHVLLVPVANRTSVVAVTMPALCGDRTSMRLLARQILQTYQSYLTAALQEDAGMQYADISEWQNETLRDTSVEARRFWLRDGIPDLHNPALPFERMVQDGGFEPAAIGVGVDAGAAENLLRLARNLSVAPRSVYLACWSIFLARYLGTPELVIRILMDGRQHPELQKALGLFEKSVPLYADHKNNRFEDFVKVVHQSLAEAEEWSDYFCAEEFAGNQSSSGPPLWFGFERDEAFSVPGLSCTVLHEYSSTGRFKVGLQCRQKENQISTELRYDSTLFRRDDIQRLADEYASLVHRAVNAPELPIREVDAVSDTELAILEQFGGMNENGPDDNSPSVHELFEAWAKAEPNALAVVCEDERISFGELNRRSNRLGHYLRGLGVGPNVLVPIFLERSSEFIVSMLGVLKAGGAYVPLDPALPKAALASRIEDLASTLIITRWDLVSRLPEADTQTMCLDANRNRIAAESDRDPRSLVGPENLAYVLFTSGSTGRPKAVAIEHRNVTSYVSGFLRRLNLSERASFATVSTFSADLGNTAIFGALCSGGCLHVVTAERASDAEAMAAYCRAHAIDCLKIVPSHLSALLDSPHASAILPRRRLILGGDSCSWDLVDRVQALKPDCVILNHYGPTETTVGVLTHEIEDSPENRQAKTAPIGRPLPGTRVYITDAQRRIVPIWVTGELCIAGSNVCRGYLNHPDLTDERFIADPFACGRMYVTGDLARWRPNGTIEFLGRRDNQVKIRGFRVELGEIEHILREDARFKDAVVIATGAPGEHRRLVAYVVPRRARDLNPTAIREFLRSRLPEYMVPETVVLLSALPLNANGKVDRMALASREPDETGNRQVFTSPRTETEALLAGLWQQVLGLEKVGIHDNFFEIGGDSILSIQIIARANQVGLKLTPKQLFEHQTIAELAEVADRRSPSEQTETGPVSGRVPMSPIQHWFFEQSDAERDHYNQSLQLELRTPLDAEILERAMTALFIHHDALRSRFVSTGAGWEQVIDDPDVRAPFLRLDFSGLSGAGQLRAIKKTSAQLQASLDLEKGPLVRAVLFDCGTERRSRLLLVIHHLVIDAVSWRILLEDLETACAQLCKGQVVRLPARTSSFKRWAEFLNEYAASGKFTDDEVRWVLPAPRDFKIPSDFEAGPNNIASERTVRVALDVNETRELLHYVPAVLKARINEVLIAALAQAITHWIGRSSLMIEVEGHGREEIVGSLDLSRTVGWFTARVPVDLEIQPSENPSHTLKHVKERLRRIPNNGIGYGISRYLARGESSFDNSPYLAPELTFNYLGQFDLVSRRSEYFARTYWQAATNRSRLRSRSQVFEIIARVTGGKLQISWKYSKNLHRRATIEALVSDFVSVISSIAGNRRNSASAGFVPSDFPLAKLDDQQISAIVGRLSRFKQGN
jgi:amino acid adenylation domain-containing protein/non-ribosomal peptide synthase protein (TIGR01720 family)